MAHSTASQIPSSIAAAARQIIAAALAPPRSTYSAKLTFRPVLDHGGRHEDVRSGRRRGDQPVDVLDGQAGVGHRGGRQPRPLFDGEFRRAGRRAQARQFMEADDCGFAPETHARHITGIRT
jgi:hypothetical protein